MVSSVCSRRQPKTVTSRDMEPSRVYHVFLISFLQYDIVIWFMVAIETVSTIGAARASTTDRWVLLTLRFAFNIRFFYLYINKHRYLFSENTSICFQALMGKYLTFLYH